MFLKKIEYQVPNHRYIANTKTRRSKQRLFLMFFYIFFLEAERRRFGESTVRLCYIIFCLRFGTLLFGIYHD